MSTAPGWYPNPENAANLRYWDGVQWTTHVQPLPHPATASPVSTAVPIATQQPQEPPQAAGGGALVADGVVGFGRNRSGIGGAIKSILVGMAILLLSLLVINPMIGANDAKPGDVTVSGTDTELAWSETSRKTGSSNSSNNRSGGKPTCLPIAEFTFDRKTFGARGNVYTSPCPHAEGDSIAVIYDPANPEKSARIANGAGSKMMMIFPGIGALLVITGLWTFIKRAGIVLIREGMKRRKDGKGGTQV